MKFENDLFEINITKKELTEEQKEQRKKRRKKRNILCLIVAVLAIGATGIGVTVYKNKKQESEAPVAMEDELREYGQVEGEYVESSKLATSLQEKYANESLYGYVYADPIEDVERSEAITFAIGYDIDALGLEKWTECYALYQDPELKYPMGVKYSFDDKTKTLYMEPSETTVPCMISLFGLDVGTVQKYPHDDHNFFGKDAGSSWGNIGTAYLACYRDKENGEELETPEVSIVTFKAEIEDTPILTYSVTQDGRIRFSWNEVEGATEYFFCEVDKGVERGYNNSLQVLSITDKCEWITDYPEYGVATANETFRIYEISEDDWKNEDYYDDNLKKYEEPDVPHRREMNGEPMEKGLCVIAVNSEGTSMISNVYDISDIASKLPYTFATNTKRENGFESTIRNYETVESLPPYDYITMCDGYTSMKLINFDTENAYLQEKRFIVFDDETGEVTGAETIKCLCIPYRVEGTSFLDTFSIAGVEEAGYNEEDLKKDLAFLEDREEKLSPKSGGVSMETTTKYSASFTIDEINLRKVDTEVFANSALSEYLATNMLGGVEIIDISDFNEARDTKLVIDALQEAYYQNPLILGIKGYRLNNDGDKIRIVYEESLESQAKKQTAIKKKVTEVVEKIITEDMTEQEKVMAINQYLCETITYDDAALQNAEENDFITVDEEFYDSFTAYGALIDGKCVCAGYSAAFRLLAEETGIESIVVTGFLDGTMAHAWNKVKIGEEWYVVDTTNNDNEFFANALLNLPNEVTNTVLVEDKEYMMDARISKYVGNSDENEYYHVTDNYFPEKEVAKILADELAKDGKATLRTNYRITDRDFYKITEAVYDIMGDDVELYGYYWLGVIYLTTEA